MLRGSERKKKTLLRKRQCGTIRTMVEGRENAGASIITDPATNRVGIRVPEFTPNDPELWFCIVERYFVSFGIVSDAVKSSYVTGALGPRYMAEVLYEKLKAELISRVGVSQEQKTRQLLEREEMGDQKPTQFLRHLRSLAGSYVTEPLLRTLWLGRLPANVQAILRTQKNTALDEVAVLADTIFETIPGRPVVAEAARPGPSVPPSALDLIADRMLQLLISLQEESKVMRGQINELRLSRRNEPSRGGGQAQSRRPRSFSRPRSRSREHSENGMCWYHARFADKAHRCIQPCTFGQGNARGGR